MSDSRPSSSHVLRGLLLIALANIKRERLRSVLIFITIALATLLFLSSLGSLNGFQKPIDNMLSSQRASHLLLYFDTRSYDSKRITDWWRTQDTVESQTPLLPLVVTPGRPIYGGRELGSLLRLTERPRKAMTQDQLVFLEGSPAPYPAPGEVWLPSSVARSADIPVGATLQIPTEHGLRGLQVTGIVVDPQYSSGFINPERAWIGPDELASLFPPGALTTYTLGIRVTNPDALDELLNDFNAEMGGGFSGTIITFDEIMNSYSFVVQMLGILLLAFAVVSLLVALFIISTTISSEILSGFRTLGILKSLGYTPGNVVALFLVQFLLVSVVAIPVGIVGAYFASQAMIGLMLQSIGVAGRQIEFFGLAAATFVGLLAVVSLVTAWSGARAGRIKPASAIRFGAPEESVSRKSPVPMGLARYLPLALVIALKNLLSGSRRQYYDVASLLATAFVLLFSVNVFHSVTMTDRNLPFWGLDGADVRIKRDTSVFGMRYAALHTYLAAAPQVSAVAGSDTLSAIIPPQGTHASRDLSGHVIDGSLDDVGYINLEGRNPESADEISLGVTLARDYGIGIGDEFELIVFGESLRFTVSGIFQGTSNSGYWFRTMLAAVQRADPQYEPGNFLVVLNDAADREAFMLDLEAQLGQAVDVEPAEKLVESQLGSIVQGLGIVLAFLSLVFVLVSAVSVFNSTAIGIHETKRQLGILKALGYTRTQIRLIVALKSGLLTFGTMAVAAILVWLFAGAIMSVLLGQVGMTAFPIIIDLPGSVLALVLILATGVLSAWIPSGRVARISARTLIIE